MLSKAEREMGYRPVPQPTEPEVAILRRVAGGFLLRTETEKGPLFHYEDGSRMTSLEKPLSKTDDAKRIDRMVARGYLIAMKGETLPHLKDAPPQRYRARTPSDGPLPKFTKD